VCSILIITIHSWINESIKKVYLANRKTFFIHYLKLIIMKKVLMIVRLTFVLMCLASLKAQAIRPDVLQTLNYHENLIEDGVFFGDISPREFRQLSKQQNKIRRTVDVLRNSYRVSHGELSLIRNMQARAEDDIYRSIGNRANLNNYPRRQNRSIFNNSVRQTNNYQRYNRNRRPRNYCG
jgi:hypothetical protein